MKYPALFIPILLLTACSSTPTPAGASPHLPAETPTSNSLILPNTPAPVPTNTANMARTDTPEYHPGKQLPKFPYEPCGPTETSPDWGCTIDLHDTPTIAAGGVDFSLSLDRIITFDLTEKKGVKDPIMNLHLPVDFAKNYDFIITIVGDNNITQNVKVHLEYTGQEESEGQWLSMYSARFTDINGTTALFRISESTQWGELMEKVTRVTMEETNEVTIIARQIH